MITKKIDLYEYFNLSNLREEKTAGYLTVYAQDKYESRPQRKRPAILVIPGGGYIGVANRENECVAFSYLAKSYSAFSLTYSCAPIKYPYQLLEAVMAMLYIRENAQEYSVDTAQVAVIGFSAGGHLAGCLSCIPNEPEIINILGDRAISARPNATIYGYPVISSGEFKHAKSFDNICGDDLELRERLSIEKRITKDCPPAFIWGTVNDDGVASENSLLLALAYKTAGVPFELHSFMDGAHGLSIGTIESFYVNQSIQPWLELSINWLNSHGFEIKD